MSREPPGEAGRVFKFFPVSTQNCTTLSPEQIEQFNQQGYLTGINVFTEAEAIEKYGEATVTTHQTTFVNMLYSREFLYDEQYQPKTRAKLVCIGEEQRIIGLHMIGLAVDVILQGFGVAMKMGATKADFDSVVAIHPTSAEEVVLMR